MVLTTDRSSGAGNPDLYVQVPAYRDLELVPTLRDLYAEAARPGRLRVRVMWQRAEDEVLPDDVRALPGLEVDEVPAATSEGCNWARRRLQEAWEGERYTLLLDSHHRFVAGWDDLALAMLEQLRAAGAVKPMLTGYLPAYHPRSDLYRSTRPQRLYPYARDGGVLTRPTAGCTTSRSPPTPARTSSAPPTSASTGASTSRPARTSTPSSRHSSSTSTNPAATGSSCATRSPG